MTYQQFKETNAKVRKSQNYQPVTIVDVVTSPVSVQMDKVVFTTGQSLTIEGMLNNISNFGFISVTNPSKLAHWRGFTK